MVKVREDHPMSQEGDIDIDRWVKKLSARSNIDDIEQVRQACLQSRDIIENAVSDGTGWASGPNSFLIGLEMAQILSELSLDESVIIAAILYRSVRESRISLTAVASDYGKEVAKLISGALEMAAISAIHHPLKGNVLGQSHGQLDNVRKMLVTMIDDVRVVLLKLAERTCAIRAVKNATPERRLRVAREVFDIYAPLAHRLGVGHLKWELEDLSFRYLHDSAYKKIAKQLDEKRVDRDLFIKDVAATLKKELQNAHIDGEVSGRSKHIYSIWRKMKRKGVDFSQIYDIRAFRILVPSVQDCYAVLGIVHSVWRHIPNEFDDYIANPKENGYRSLHTAVIGPGGKIIEVQIRTRGMHEEAELGVCAHWLYKGTDRKNKSASYEEKINWLRQVLEWQEEIGDLTGLVEQIKFDVTSDRVYVFTPDGHVVDLPQGATPVDFAYRVHTEVGHGCRGAKVNGRIVPLTYPLKTGDQVTILSSNNPAPSRDWLNAGLGYIQTSRARAKVTHWFKQQDREQNIIDGRAILEDEMKRLSVDEVNLRELARAVNYHTVDDMFAAIGAGDLKPAHVANKAQQITEPKERQLGLELNRRPSPAHNQENDIQVCGVGKLKTSLANCCKPLPGEPIVGYITVGRGVSIHREDCQNAMVLRDSDPNRFIEVSWGGKAEDSYSVDISILSYDRSGLLRDITVILANEKVNLLDVNTQTNSAENTVVLKITLEVSGLGQLGKVLAQIKQIPNVVEAKRVKSA
ncbi:MAG: GTP diphosphokinase [Proteobacteria bacterium]|nr:MAG: GTP diphosphokinase [Pseudomonadota bacterium]PIE40422.1 MAG: GTP diphosphokinase [Gammaproteobacteria bacterium]